MTAIRAAVLVPIRLVDGVGPVMTMIRRTTGGPHSGQMAFPGGRYDRRLDDSLLDTALRESTEEVGIDPAHVDIVGALPDRHTLSSAYVVSPYVARIPEPYAFKAAPREVARVVDAPLADFRDPGRRHPLSWQWQGRAVEVPSVLVDGEVVWGLSLAIIDDFLASDLLAQL